MCRKIRKKLFIVLVVLFGVSFMTAGSVTAKDQKVYNLRMQILFGPSMMYQYEPFIEYVEKASNGRIKIHT